MMLHNLTEGSKHLYGTQKRLSMIFGLGNLTGQPVRVSEV